MLTALHLAGYTATIWIWQASKTTIKSTSKLLTSALGHHACQRGHKVYYRYCSKLFDELKLAKADGSYIKELNRIEKLNLLILDDFGLKPLENNQQLMLLELLEDRHGKRSTIITSQLPVKSWYEVIGEPTIADAILDRLVT